MQGRFEKRGDVGIIWINNPPVNAISVGVRTAIIDGVTKLAQDAEIKVGVLACEGRTFMAGADITEFGKPPLSPGLHEALTLAGKLRQTHRGRHLWHSLRWRLGSCARLPLPGRSRDRQGRIAGSQARAFSRGPAARNGCRG